MDNLAIAKQAYQDFAEGNIEGVVAIMHPEVEWHVSPGFPYVSGDGVVVGPQTVVQNVFAPIPECYDGFTIDVREFFGSGDKVVMVGYLTGVWKETGKRFKANVVHVTTLKDGKMTHFFEAADTAEIIGAG